MTIFAALPPTPAQAQTPGATLRVLTPRQGESLGTLKFNLDVSFKSLSASPVTTAELWVDGVRWVRRDLDAPRQASTLSFEVDGTSLSAGQHTIVVKVFTENGGVSSTQVQVVAGTNEGVLKGDFGGPEMTFLTPGNGKRVSGTVELLIDAKPKNGQNPYITIYVDKQFKTLRNYPPYSYTWDTTQVSNGYHTVEASGYLDSSNATTTRTMRVYVDNPGGNTVRMGDIPDLTEARNQTEANPTTAASVASRPLTIPLPKSGAPSLAAPSGEAKLAGAGSIASDAAPAALGLAAGTAPSAARAAVDVRLALPRSAAGSAAVKAEVKPNAAAEGEKVTSAAEAATPVLAVANVEVKSAPTLATPRPVAPKAAPAAAVASPVKKVSLLPMATAKPAPKVEAKTTLGTPRARTGAAAVRPAAAAKTSFSSLPEMANQRKAGLQVAFDGQLIAFDVQPRVEAGVPIAPFRQIFEHTGGKLTWAPDTKVVHAVNAEREIVIAVGNGTARVNGTAVLMERAATIENGRTIVPLSFVGQALDVEVKHDPATGRLSITSKK